jgi:membrane fusion protein (multidrug efflux system)
VPVRVVFTDPQQLDKHPLRIGLSTDVTVNLHDQQGAMLALEPPTRPVLSTEVYQQQLHKADDLIAGIIHANMAGNGN